MVVLLGGSAVKSIFGNKVKLSEMVGQTLDYAGVPVVVSYHPAYILRSPRARPQLVAAVAAAARLARGEEYTPPKEVGCVDGEVVSVDVECDPEGALLCLAEASSAHAGNWVPIEHSSAVTSFDPRRWVGRRLIGQNFAFDLGVIEDYSGVDLSDQWTDDTMLMSHLLDENLPKGLKFQSSYRLGVPNYAEDTREFSRDYPTARLKKYNIQDACATFGLWQQYDRMLDEEGLRVIYEKITMPAARLAYRMHRRGIKLDYQMVEDKLASILAEREEIGDALDPDVNWQPGSKSFKEFMAARFPLIKRTPNGQPSWDIEVLHTLLYQAESKWEISNIIRWRNLEGQRKFLKSWLDLMDHNDQLHPVFNVAGTETGRLSAQKPNIQQVPRGELRDCFVPREGYVFVDCDFSQLEVRLAALRAREETMIAEYGKENPDLHQLMADRAGVSRQQGKTLNLAFMYGMRPDKFVETQMRRGEYVRREDAQRYYDVYHETYPGLRRWYEEEIDFARVHGFAQDPLGRRRRLPEIHERNMQLRSHAEKQAVNFPIQSFGNALCLMAAVHVDEFLRKTGMGAVVAVVHDEILVETQEHNGDFVLGYMLQVMETPDLAGFAVAHGAEFDKVPLVAEGGVGKTWKEAK